MKEEMKAGEKTGKKADGKELRIMRKEKEC